jgi:hypothetical protein
MEAMRPMSIQHKGRRYRPKCRSAGDDIHPLPLRASFSKHSTRGRISDDNIMHIL